MLRLTTFGGVALRTDSSDDPSGAAGEQSLPRRGLALLVLLAAAPEAGVSRDTLVAYLWPESDEERARAALRQTLFALRRELETPELLSGGGVGLTLNPAALTSDVREFDLARASGDLERAARLYAGPFLDGFHLRGAPEFERWVERQRVEYAARAAGALETLARRAGEQGEPGVAVEWWRRLSASDPLNTRFVLELMAAEAAAGNPAGAIRRAQAHEALVGEELGAPPDPALAAMVARLRTGAPPGGRMPEPGRASASQPATPPAPDPGTPRQRERTRDLLERELGDRYAFEQEVETGRDGHVRLLRAHDRRHDRPVTVKVLHPALASRIDVERFVREIRFTAKLQHPHILPLLDSGEVAGRPWYAIPRPKGETLRSRLSREGLIPADEAVVLTLELADALGQAHAEGIVHRDVSPENVLLAASPPSGGGTAAGCHALLTNLGLARALDAAAGADLTVTGMLVGTAAYMSPEQAEGAAPVDERSDIYSLAAVLYEMLTGEPLFSGPTAQAIMAKRAAGRSPLEGRLDGVPPRVAPVLIKALAKKPGARFRSAAEFAQALDPASERVHEVAGRWRRWLGLGG